MSEAKQLERLVQDAVAGDRDAIAAIVSAVERDLYGLALRMLWHREDAEDATQEILVRLVTRLSQFDHRSSFRTWAFRVATNYLLDVRKSPVERLKLNFTALAEDLGQGLSADGPTDGERSVLVAEVKIGCTLAMLQCLDRPHRIAYVLGEIFEFEAREASLALGIEPPAFRKRLQRAREALEAFTRAHCGLVSDEAACQCNRRVAAAVRLGRARADAPFFAAASASFDEARAEVRRLEDSRRALEVFRTSRPNDSAVEFARRLVSALDSQ